MGLGPGKNRVAGETHFAEEFRTAFGDGGRLGDPNVVFDGGAHWEFGYCIIRVRVGLGVGTGVGSGAGARGGDNAIERLVEALGVFVFFPSGFAHRLLGIPIW